MIRVRNTFPKYRVLAMFFMVAFVFSVVRFLTPISPVRAVDVTVTATIPGVVPTPAPAPPPTPQTPMLYITNLRVPVVGYTNAAIAWDTNVAATSFIDYGLTNLFELGTVSDTASVYSRQLPISGLTPGTLYYFRVRSQDAFGNWAQQMGTFTTLSESRGFAITISVINITSTSATVIWTTDRLATSYAEFGLTTTYGRTASDSNLVIEHALDMTNLRPGTLYHVQGQSTDSAGLLAISQDVTFTTLVGPDTIPPSSPMSFVVTNVPNRPALQLNWVNPTDSDFAGVIVRACTDRFPVDENDCRFVYQGTLDNFLDDNLTPDTTYYYALFAYDTSNNFSAPLFQQGTIPPIQTFAMKIRPEKRIPKKGRWDVDGAVYFRNPGSTRRVESIEVSVPRSGELTVTSQLKPGIFDAGFKGLGYLNATIPNFRLEYGSRGDFSYGETKVLLGGDVHVTNDNLVNPMDITTMTQMLSGGYIVTDLNRDGIVNSLDMGILLSNFMRWGER